MQPTLLAAIAQRYACRDFAADPPVTADELAVLVEAGRLAPSAFGLEPWRFVTVTDPAGMASIARACFDQPAAATAAAFVVIVALVEVLDPDSDYVRARFEAETRGADTSGIDAAYRQHYHPDAAAAWSQGQCNFAAAHILLQAAHMGLGSCPIGGYDPAALSGALKLPAGETPALVIALGHCRVPAPERLRKPLAR